LEIADLVLSNSWAHRNRNESGKKMGKENRAAANNETQPNKQNKCAIKEVDRIEQSEFVGI